MGLIENRIDNLPLIGFTGIMIVRDLQVIAHERVEFFPVLTITGPRQSGKTTLCKETFKRLPYVSIEAPDVRAFALTDPRGFLGQYQEGAVIDEIQRAPDLLSYLQVVVDEDPRPGRFILTGSQNFALVSTLSQSLAGRSAVLHLHPLTYNEILRFDNAPKELFQVLWTGGYPAIYDRRAPADEWISSYISLYVERDVRQVLNVGDLTTFQDFLRLCAGRAGQLVNLSALGGDAGVTHNTAKAWLSVLETSFIVFRLNPFSRNLTSRVVKTPKFYFMDTGLLCALIGIRTPEELFTHPLRGSIFENWVVSEVYKRIAHQGRRPLMSFFRDRKGFEVDLIIEDGRNLTALEIKSGQTPLPDFADNLVSFAKRMREDAGGFTVTPFIVYGGEAEQRRGETRFLSWKNLDAIVHQ